MDLPFHQAINTKDKFSNEDENGRSKGQIVDPHGLSTPYRCEYVRNPQLELGMLAPERSFLTLLKMIALCIFVVVLPSLLPCGSGQVLPAPEKEIIPDEVWMSETPPTKNTLPASLTLGVVTVAILLERFLQLGDSRPV